MTEGEIAIVTLPDLKGHTVEELARRIGNTWGVGAARGPARQAGAVVLVIPKETSSDGRGYCRIELATSICVAATPSFRARAYGHALTIILDDLAHRYHEKFGDIR